MKIDFERYDAVTFDCYGTLIDWDTGVANFLGPWAVKTGFPGTVSDLLGKFGEYQRKNQGIKPFKNYRIVIRDALASAVTELGGAISDDDLDAFASSVETWPAFPDTVDGLRHLKASGLHIGVLSNVDSLSFEASHVRLGGLVDTIVTAEMVEAYKPDLEMFHTLFAALKAKGIRQDRILHLAQSRFHDVAPGNEIGLDVIWIDRRFGRPGHGVTIESDAEPKLRFSNLAEFCASSRSKAA